MKSSCLHHLRGTAIAVLAVFGLLAGVGSAKAQSVFLTFTGGGGTPLTISWSSPILFTATGFGSASGGARPFFVFRGLGDVYSNVQHETVVATSPSYTGVDGTGTIN